MLDQMEQTFNKLQEEFNKVSSYNKENIKLIEKQIQENLEQNKRIHEITETLPELTKLTSEYEIRIPENTRIYRYIRYSMRQMNKFALYYLTNIPAFFKINSKKTIYSCPKTSTNSQYPYIQTQRTKIDQRLQYLESDLLSQVGKKS